MKNIDNWVIWFEEKLGNIKAKQRAKDIKEYEIATERLKRAEFVWYRKLGQLYQERLYNEFRRKDEKTNGTRD